MKDQLQPDRTLALSSSPANPAQVKGDSDIADLTILNSLVANGAVRNGGSDNVNMADNVLQTSREQINSVLSKGIIAATYLSHILNLMLSLGDKGYLAEDLQLRKSAKPTDCKEPS